MIHIITNIHGTLYFFNLNISDIYIYIYGNVRSSPSVFLPTGMWLLKSLVDLKLLLLTFYLSVILKATPQLEEYQKKLGKPLAFPIYIYMGNAKGSPPSVLLAFSQSYVENDLRKKKIVVAPTTHFFRH
jgi:hypothetical protein